MTVDVPTEYYRLPPDQWPEAAPPPGAPPRRDRGWLSTALFAGVAVAAAGGLAAVGPDVIGGGRGGDAAGVAAVAPPAEEVEGTATTTPPVAIDPTRAVYLITVDACGRQGTGSGFALDEHHVVTNAHVVQGDAHPQLRAPTGERYVGRVIGVHGWDDDGLVDLEGPPDVAVIRVDVPLPARVVWASGPPGVGQVLSGMTFPDGVYTPTTGTVVERHRQGFAIRGDFGHGSSGGPVLGADGEVYGVVTAGRPGGGLVFAFDAAALRPLVEAFVADPQPLSDDCSLA